MTAPKSTDTRCSCCNERRLTSIFRHNREWFYCDNCDSPDGDAPSHRRW